MGSTVQRGITGRDFEERLRTKLGTWCNIQHDQVLDHEYKIDFAILSFRDVPKFTPQIGIQVTVKDDDATKQSQFLGIHRDGQIVPKSVFLEVDSGVNLDGAANVACFALGAFAFGKEHQATRTIGLRIARDLAFEFFNIEDNVRRLQAATVQRPQAARSHAQESVGTVAASSWERDLSGEVDSFNVDRGFGFIKCGDRPDEQFYLHISKADGGVAVELRERQGTPGQVGWRTYDTPIAVKFDDGGLAPGQRYRTAVNARLAHIVPYRGRGGGRF